MADKMNSPKKATAKPSARETSAARAKVKQQPAALFYLEIVEARLSLDDQKPRNGKNVQQFTSYQDAREAAIDALLAEIERSERRLTELKRASSLAELRAAADA